jgi:fibrillarin-like pre-rRNA processing protein
MKELFPGIFLISGKLATENSVPNYKPFDEDLLKINKREFRLWNPYRSKAAAAIKRSVKIFPIKKDIRILYLGAAHGYTPSFLANIIGNRGIIYAVEFSERCFNEFLPLCLKYKNIIPILADARKPENYAWIEKVDVIYVDIAQPDETEIAIRNCKEFLKEKGYLLMAIKSRSIDVVKSPKKVYNEEIKKLKEAGFEIKDWKTLDPYEKAHAFVIAKIKH